MEHRFRRYRSDHDLSRCGVYDQAGGYRSQWYPGLENGMEWLRLSLEGIPAARVRVYTADQPPESWSGDLEPALEREAADLSLYGVRGRCLCFTVTPAAGLSGFSLTFPGRSIDAGLPLALRDDATLRQFLAVYQSVYMDTNQAAAHFPGRLDPHHPDPLPDLKFWVGAARWMRDAPCLPDLLAAAPKLNRMRGTRRGLELLIKLVTGGQGELVEDFQWRGRPVSAEELEACSRLYGSAHASAALLLPADAPACAIGFLESVLDDFIPVGVTYSILQLKNGTAMDGHSYLDVNAELREPPQAVLDETVLDDLTLE